MKRECIAMLLAGGQGSRLESLTKRIAKPAVPFGGKYRIIDFSLSNCNNSGINTIGVLTQYKPTLLNSYIGIGSDWDLDVGNGGVYILPPFVGENGGEWYKGTANAVYQNIDFIDYYEPKYVLVISGDHIYKMDYSLMLDYHKKKKADLTIAVIQVAKEETGRFGIMENDENNRIINFKEKPKETKSNLASMGIYIFNWPVLKEQLSEDDKDPQSEHDFGKNIIPAMLKEQHKMYAYPFEGYWKDVGTIDSYYRANMDLLEENPKFNIFDDNLKIYSKAPFLPPHYIGAEAKVKRSLVPDGCVIMGEVDNSVLFPGVYIGKGTRVQDSIIMPQAKIGDECIIRKAIIGENTSIENNCRVGVDNGNVINISDITVIGDNIVLPRGTKINKNSQMASWRVNKSKIS